MRVLFIVPNPPSLVRVRPYNLIRHLRARGHEITIAAPWSDSTERADIERLRAQGFDVETAFLSKPEIIRNLLRALVGGLPLQATYAVSATLRRALVRRVAADPPDLVHVEHLRGAAYGLVLQQALPVARLPMVWDSVDCISYLFEQAATYSRSLKGRLLTAFELPRTRWYEGRLVPQFDRVLATSSIDKAALEALAAPWTKPAPPPSVTVLPNGVDLDYFTPGEEPRQPETIVFSGKMSYHANATAALHLVNDIMPLVWEARPDARVWIVGKDPTAAVQALARRYAQVTVTGAVPDLRPYLRRATLAVAPLVYGAGIQNKVLEAMACATPVIASRRAVLSLQAIDEEHLLAADGPARFAQQILRLLADPELRARLGEAGRRYVETHHAWDRIVDDLAAIYHALITR
jgi:sugar transferase (PEP-CTERM/EpsH1 system associated)